MVDDEYKHVDTGNSMTQLDDGNYSESVTVRGDNYRHRDRVTYCSLSEGEQDHAS
jgi:hypothetical protein